LGIGPGDEVIVPDLTFGACANAVMHCGARPVFTDVSRAYWNLDPELIETAISSKTKAIMAVHLYGHPCDMAEISVIANKHGLFVIEDCAEAIGARYKGKLVGTMGDVGCFSFFSNKIITTGEGGMVITRNRKLQEKMMVLRDHGMEKGRRYRHDIVGFNYRMTNIQAAIGLAQLEQIDVILNRRSSIKTEYQKLLQDCEDIRLPPKMTWAQPICWLFSILIDPESIGMSRDAFMLELEKDGIDTRPFFYPMHEQGAFPKDSRQFPVSREISSCGISLPTSNQLTMEEIERVCSAIKRIIKNSQDVVENTRAELEAMKPTGAAR
jgi:perosamine synthetase